MAGLDHVIVGEGENPGFGYMCEERTDDADRQPETRMDFEFRQSNGKPYHDLVMKHDGKGHDSGIDDKNLKGKCVEHGFFRFNYFGICNGCRF